MVIVPIDVLQIASLRLWMGEKKRRQINEKWVEFEVVWLQCNTVEKGRNYNCKRVFGLIKKIRKESDNFHELQVCTCFISNLVQMLLPIQNTVIDYSGP